eukprot:scaffold9706_cov69-Phaeocystis_antarctica.AAC.3
MHRKVAATHTAQAPRADLKAQELGQKAQWTERECRLASRNAHPSHGACATRPIRQSQKAGSAPSGSASALPTRVATAMRASLLVRRFRSAGCLAAAASASSEARGGDGGVEGGGEPAGGAETSTCRLM